ncbi:TonB-dependent receptor [Acidiferrobacter sp.]|uniref:TonB-dependent receptor n=1 Tax=Acidiferrobacter sp. TaxID=1872107 RepID=UPI00260FC4DF|nr:TonB-dependent receptor [Acidiferrobacter sp.]
MKIASVSKTGKKHKGRGRPVVMGGVHGAPVASLVAAALHGDEMAENAQTVLNSMPGTNVTSTNPLGTRPHISVRGFSGTQLGYTFDGLPIGDLFSGGLTGGNNNYASLYNLVPVTLGESSGINVIYGPAEPSVDSVGGMGGTVEYMPRLPGKTFSASVFGGFGSFDTRNYGAEVNTGASKNGGALFLRAAHHSTGNYLENSPDRGNSFYGAYVLPSRGGRSRFSAIVLYNNNSGYIPARMPAALLSLYGPNYQWPQSFTYSYGQATHEMVVLGYKTEMNRYILLDSKAFYAYTRSDQLTYQNPAVTPTYDGNITYFPYGNGAPYNRYIYVTRTAGLSEAVNLMLGPDTVTFGGFGAASIYHSSQYWLASPGAASVPGQNDAWDEHAYRLYGKIYAQAELKFLGALTIVPGVKEEYADTAINDIPGAYYPVGASSGNNYTEPSPYLGASYKVTRDVKVYGNVAQAYKFPNISAYYSADSFATPTSPPPGISVLPERVTSYQIGVAFRSRRTALGAAFYRQYFAHTFSSVYDATNGLTYEYNYGASRYTGLDLTGSYKPGYGLKIYGGWSLQSAQYTSNATNSFGSSVSAGDPRQYTPHYLANIGVEERYARVTGALWANFVGSQVIGTSAGGPTTGSVPAYRTVNASLTYTLPIHAPGIKSLKASLNITNILNSHAYIYEKQFIYPSGTGTYNEAEPMMPRFVGVELTATF